MEKRIENLENQVIALALAVKVQSDTIGELTNCINHIYNMLKRDTEFDSNLFTYCKELRKEIDKLKTKTPV